MGLAFALCTLKQAERFHVSGLSGGLCLLENILILSGRAAPGGNARLRTLTPKAACLRITAPFEKGLFFCAQQAVAGGRGAAKP